MKINTQKLTTCNACQQGGLFWRKKERSGQWVLHESESGRQHRCDPEKIKNRKLTHHEKQYNMVAGFRFNNRNLEEGLLTSIITGKYYVKVCSNL